MKSGFPVAPDVAHSWHHDREKRRQQFLQIIADKEILLPWLADDGRRINGVLSVKNSIRSKYRIVVL